MIIPKYEDQLDNELICPYCEHRFDNSWESCSEDSEKIDCPNCGKYFWGYMQKSIDYNSKPDCNLNKEEHQFGDEEINGYLICKICGALKKSNAVAITELK